MNKYQKETLGKLKEAILYKRIVATDGKQITLEDGHKIAFECTEWDCCADALGSWESVSFDGMITDVQLADEKQVVDCEGKYFLQTHREAKLVLFHNQNEVSIANLEADNGNGDYYYSVLSVTIDDKAIGDILYSYSLEDGE